MGISTTVTKTDRTVEQSAIRKVATRLVPFVALMFFINYLDRTAIGFAAPNGMNEDLGLSAAQFGFASGVFFIGYILLEVPEQPRPAPVRRPTLAGPDHGHLGHRRRTVHLGAVVRPAEHPAVPARCGRGRLLPGRDLVPEPVGAGALPQPHPRSVLPGPAADHRDRRPAGRLADQQGRSVLRPRGLAVHVPRRRAPGDRRRHHRLVLPGRQPGQGQVAHPGRGRLADRGTGRRGRVQEVPRRQAPEHPLRLQQRQGLAAGHDLLRLHLRPVHPGVLPADDHRRLRGPVRRPSSASSRRA